MLLQFRSRNGSRVLLDTAGFRTMELTGAGQLHLVPHAHGSNILALTPDETKTLKEVTDIADVFRPTQKREHAVA